ncbi:hypothetical protein V9T40_014892 [Parthenolecanium corni]|uniref:CHK kinase-like domain-containing protein n=1 Tax=Parthenolecanium corni TaxID=536013 RepID=A0AAN9Y7E1_9HEMI
MIPFQNITDQDVIHEMKECLPKGDKFQIEESSIVEGYQHYVGDIIRLVLKYEEDGIEDKKFLVLKVPKNDDSAAAFSKIDMIVREPFVYEVIIPVMNEYLDETLSPLYYKTIDSKIIVLEDLVKIGYDGGENNRQPYGLNQCFPVLKALAHFHATTHKLCQTKPHLLEPKMFHYSPLLEFRQYLTEFWETILLELLSRNNECSLIPKLKKANVYLRKENDDAAAKVHYSNFNFYILNHGDFRKDNILLKYGSNNVVDGVKILDFQTCFWSTPVYDFMYFFMLSTSVEIIENHFEKLLNWYLECLNEKLNEINCAQAYHKQEFMADIKNVSLCFINFVNVNALMLCPLDRNKLSGEIFQKQKNYEYYMEACLKDQLFVSSVLSDLKLCDKLGIFENILSNDAV